MRYIFFVFLSIITAVVIWSFCLNNSQHISANNTQIHYNGRIDFSDSLQPSFYYPGTEITILFSGTSCTIKLGQESFGDIDEYGNPHTNFYTVLLDGKHTIIKAKEGLNSYQVGKQLKDTIHTLQIWKRTEAICGRGYFGGITIDKSAKLFPVRVPKRKIEFIGNSITCGYGLDGDNKDCKFSAATENNYLTYGAIVARKLDAEYRAVAYSGKGIFQNFGGGREDVMPDLYQRQNPLDEYSQWNLKSWIPDLVVINLGTNDFAHEVPDSAGFVKNYAGLLRTIQGNYPDAKIVCLISQMLSDHWPVGVNARTNCKKFIEAAISELNSKNIYVTELSAQGDNGYGCDYHPNKKQNEINGAELTTFIMEEVVK